MFVGHLALAFAAKRATPALSLGWLMAAVTALDLLWPLFLLAGLEQVRVVPGATAFTPLVFDAYPWSHSLVMSLVWGVCVAGLARARHHHGRAIPLLIALVMSHWVLDYVTHAPDMPLWPGSSPKLGLVLWNSIPGTFMVEGALLAAGVALFLRGRRPTRPRGAIAFWSLIVVTTGLWAVSPFSPPAPDTRALAVAALIGGWITVPWAILADRNYAPRSG